jgi:hypothetical protein
VEFQKTISDGNASENHVTSLVMTSNYLLKLRGVARFLIGLAFRLRPTFVVVEAALAMFD